MKSLIHFTDTSGGARVKTGDGGGVCGGGSAFFGQKVFDLFAFVVDPRQ